RPPGLGTKGPPMIATGSHTDGRGFSRSEIHPQSAHSQSSDGVEVTQLVGHLWRGLLDGLADRVLPVGDRTGNRHLRRAFDATVPRVAEGPGQRVDVEAEFVLG